MELGLAEIKRRLMHRFPMLLIDRVLEVDEGKSCVALKNVSANEQFFLGHFPEEPIMPGVLILECMAQAGGIASFHNNDDPENTMLMLAGVDKAKFRIPVRPGDRLLLKVEFTGKKMSVWFLSGKAYIQDADGKERLAASALLKVVAAPLVKK